jgi:hypothetical protein
MKRITLFFALLAIATVANAQIKISYNGNVGIGIDPTYAGCKLRVAYGGNDFTFMPNFGGSINLGGYIASDPNATRIDFWHPVAGWNKVRFKGYTLSSDSSLKTDIVPLKNATDVLNQIKTYSYFFKSDDMKTRKREYGILAQEIEAILPELVDSSRGLLFVDYNAFIPILIKGFNEQQSFIQKQQKEIELLQKIVFLQEQDLPTLQDNMRALQETVFSCCGKSKSLEKSLEIPNSTEKPQQLNEQAILYQNAPNPFSSNTEITCYIPEHSKQAFLYIYNLQGVELKAYSLTKAGFQSVIVNGSELTAGMYLYTLVVDNEIVDTKRMILTK